MKKLLIFALLGLAISAKPVWAESDGSAAKKSELLTEYAQCVVATNLEESRNSILKPVYLDRMTKIIEELSVRKCVDETNGFNPLDEFSSEAVRYEVARVLVQREIAIYQPIDFTSLPPLKHGTRDEIDPTKSLSDKDFKSNAVMFMLLDHASRTGDSKVGECIVRKDPESSWNVIVNGKSVDEDRKLVSKMRNALNGCLTGERQFAVSQLVGMLSVNYYRLVTASLTQEQPDA